MKKRPRAQKRHSISKRIRFEIFARDGFTCRYCGTQSDKCQLVIDHIIPVCQGGSNAEVNLITSCDECNSGKGGNTIEQSVPNETHRLRLAQEFQEQNALNKAATEAAKLEIEARQSIVNAYCDLFGRDSMQNKCVNNYHCLLKQYGAKLLFEWLRIASANLPNESDTNVVKYIYGIRRNYEADLEYEEEKNSGKK